MVRRGSAFAKNSRREIRRTLGRYVAIMAIVALGVGFFSGLRVTRQAMLATGDQYLSGQSFQDFRLISTYGLTQEDVAAFGALDEVETAVGGYQRDFLQLHADGSVSARKALMLTEVNQPLVKAGRLPQRANEVLADSQSAGEGAIGQTVIIASDNAEDTREAFTCEEYVIVGVGCSPLYMNTERGTTALADGRLGGFYYFLPQGLDFEYYTEADLLLRGSGDGFSDDYKALRDGAEPVLTATLEQRAQIRFADILSDAEAELAEGREEYEKGLADYQKERSDAEQELADAETELAEARQVLDDAKAELDASAKRLDTAEQELKAGESRYQEGKATLNAARAEFEKTKSETEQAFENQQKEVDTARASAEEALAQLTAAGAEEMMEQYPLLQQTEAELEAAIAALEAMPPQKVPSDETGEDAPAADMSEGEGLAPSITELQAQLQQVQAAKQLIENSGLLEAWRQVQDGLRELDAAQEALNESKSLVEEQLAGAEAQLLEKEMELAAAESTLQSARNQLSSGQRAFSEGVMSYQKGEEEYQQGLADYLQAKEKAETLFADAEAELSDAEGELADAEAKIAELEEPATYVLNRDTNVGYVCFENDSRVVESVAKVFPLFFFLVAALVIITTMTRMVDDQRTQIGTLKSLGYSNGRITFKYVSYAGSAALLGSLLGFFAGSIVFPKCIWMGYALLYNFGDIRVVFNYRLGLLAVLAALVCSAGTTLLVCRQDLRQVPAELMRPRAPAVGKRIWLERIPFLWRHFSFLHKVTARNIFRYKKRLIMMVLGIGGCAALVITGLGLKDSIGHIGSDQFGGIMKYDYSISFPETMEEQERQAFGENTAGLLSLCVQACGDSMDASGNGVTKQATLMACSDENIAELIQLSDGSKTVAWPGDNRVVISDNLAKRLNLQVGDSLTLHPDEFQSVELEISGIFKNYVYYYVLMNERTYESALNRTVEYNTTLANAGTGDKHEIAAELVNEHGAASVSVMEDLRDRVDRMLGAMDYIAALVIACAGALAFVVLFNLSNINLTERIREIATIEVLGFSDRETAAYVFRENLVLTLMGIVLGLPLGKLLHAYVMSEITIDMVAFETRIAPLSYALAVVLTFGFTVLVDLIMRRKLRTIDMAEALKSVE